MVYDAVIVGAGSAGLSCARRLQDAEADFRIVSDTLGGRIAYDPEQRVNFGAHFVMANYHHASKLVRRETWINPLSCRFHDGHGGHLVEDSVTGHAEDGGVHEVTCSGGLRLQARNIVFATPAVVTAKFLGLGEIRGTCQLYVDHVRGRLRPGLDGEQMNLFPSSSPVIFTARQDDGSYLVYSRERATDLGELFTEHELIGRREWEKAMYVSGRAYIEQQYGPSTYVAGDHNGLGLEPAAISGSYAAGQILAKLPR
jgi:glycine/D-amino acid oxidase-like deaminating enzyme